ncbi:MAG: hypothetical protein ACLPYO_21195 [Mycobacterium sp.]
MDPFTYFAQRATQRSGLVAGRVLPGVEVRVCVEGLGDWGTRVYRPAIAAAVVGGQRISAHYRDVRTPALDPPLKAWETFEKKRSPYEPPDGDHDVLIVATPDAAHAGVLDACAAQVRTAIVEKPFATTVQDVIRARDLPALVLGVDHFPAYISAVAGYAEEIWNHLGGTLESVRFVLLQSTPIEAPRLPSLGLGLTYDMLPHFLALLVSLGIVGPLEAATVRRAGRHSPPQDPPAATAYSRYGAETWSETEFSMATSASHPPVSCVGLVGKGFPVDVRFIEFVAASGAAVRCDLGSRSWRDLRYPYAAVSLLTPADGSAPLLSGLWLDYERIVAIGPSLSTTRPYTAMVNELMGGIGMQGSSASFFSIDECQWMMSVLEPLGSAARDLANSEDRVDHNLGAFPTPQR